MRKLFLSIIALMFSIGLWAQGTTQTVSYLYPVYNTTDDPTSGIKEWQTGTVEATVITDGSHLASFQAGWYVVTNTVVNTLSITCKGAAHLILADGAKLTVTGDSERAGIVVSGDENSLTIYGQTAQTGQLIATGSQGTGGTNDKGGAGIGGDHDSPSSSKITINGGVVTANGREQSAGIGGGESGSASNITINGGTVTANGGFGGSGIGGGENGSASNITINGGVVTANGGYYASGIGGGHGGGSASNITINGGTVSAKAGNGASGIGKGWSSLHAVASNIFVATTLIVKADDSNPPVTEIENTGNDLAGDLDGKRYVSIAINLPDYKAESIAAINAAVEGVTDEDILAIAHQAIEDINAATSVESVDLIRIAALRNIAIAKINVAIEGLTLFPKENEHIDYMIDCIQNADDDVAELTNQTMEYIALHPDKVAAIADVKTAMGNYAKSQTLYNYIGCLAIESADNANGITTAKEAALAKLNEVKAILDDVYAAGKVDALGPLGEEQPGPAVKVTKDDTEVILYLPDKVEYIIRK